MRLVLPLLTLAILALAAVSLLAGPVWLSPATVAAALADPQPSLARLLIVEVRLPRLVLSLMVGAILGLAGAVLQGLLRNPLAEPGLLGASSGASLGAVIAIYYGFAASAGLATPIFALVGALVAVGIAFALSRTGGTLSLILAGVAVSTLASAGVSLALNLAPNPFAAYEIVTWLMGSLADRSWDHVTLAAPFIALGATLLAFTARGLDALTLGERQAESLGVDVSRLRPLALIGTAAGVGARLMLRVGGKVGPMSGDPLDLEVEVLACRADAAQAGLVPGSRDPLGAAVALRVQGVDVVLNSIRQQVFSPDCFTELGIALKSKRLAVVKSTQHFRAGFDPLAASTVYADTPGSLRINLGELPYRHLRRPLWPMDGD
ncbi:MAG TPA: ABC transporter permease [Sphingomonas bacterium]|uniref:ABC transporter permease n=1 Tax=Sphingomonas bacterium TaxID=1895847 RepID=A0A3D0WD54_9SPHN|nr:ABC transporter permease [Sphingomonas bacterium]